MYIFRLNNYFCVEKIHSFWIINLINSNKMKIEEKYDAPQVEVIEVEVEQGFALSGNVPDSDDTEFP